MKASVGSDGAMFVGLAGRRVAGAPVGMTETRRRANEVGRRGDGSGQKI